MSKESILGKIKNLDEKLADKELSDMHSFFENAKKNLEKDLESLGGEEVKVVDDEVWDKLKNKQKPKATKKTPPKKKPTKKKPTKKQPTKDEYESAMADLNKKSGKTEEECLEIIEKYRALRKTSQERKAKENKAKTKKNADEKKRTDKLKEQGKLNEEGTLTPEAVIEQDIPKVEEKAEKEIEQIVEENTPKPTNQEPKPKPTKQGEKKIKEGVKEVAEDTTKAIQEMLMAILGVVKKFKEPSVAKASLVKLRDALTKEINKMASGGLTDGAVANMNVTQSQMSAESVNPQMYAKGGGVDEKEYIVETEIEDENGETISLTVNIFANSEESAMDKADANIREQNREYEDSSIDVISVTAKGREVEELAENLMRQDDLWEVEGVSNETYDKYHKLAEDILKSRKIENDSYEFGGLLNLDAISKNPPYAVAIDTYGEGDPDDIFVGFYKDNRKYGGGRSYVGRGSDKNVRWSMKDVFNDGYEPKIFQTIEDYRTWVKGGKKMPKVKVSLPFANGGMIGEYEVGDIVRIGDTDNPNYDDYRGKDLKITNKATNTNQHQGFDSTMDGYGLYDMEVVESGEDVPFSLYDYELELSYAHGGMTQGYNDRMDESLGMRHRGHHSQSHKDRRDEAKGMNKGMGNRAYQSVRSMDKMAKGGEIASAIFSPNSKKGKISTSFGDKTKEGLTAMIENDSYSAKEIANAIFEFNEKRDKVETNYGDKTKEGLIAMIESARESYAKGGEIETKREFVEVVNQVKDENEAFPNDFVNVMDSINAILLDRGYEEDEEYIYDVRQEILDRYEKKVLDKQGLRFAKGGRVPYNYENLKSGKVKPIHKLDDELIKKAKDKDDFHKMRRNYYAKNGRPNLYATGGKTKGQTLSENFNRNDNVKNIEFWNNNVIVENKGKVSRIDLDKGERINLNAKGGSTNSNWIQDVVDSPNFEKGAFTRKAKNRGMTTMELMKDVLSNPNEYTLKTRRQAQFMKNAM